MTQLKRWNESMSKVIDTLTQVDFHGAFQKLLERYKCIAAGGDYFERDLSFMCVLSIKVPIRKKSENLFNDPRKIGSAYLIKGTAQVFVLLIRFLLHCLFSSSFLVGLKSFFLSYFFFHLHLFNAVCFQYLQVLVIFISLSILILSWFYSFWCYSFACFHYQHWTFFKIQFYSNNGERESSLLISVWIFTSVRVYTPAAISIVYCQSAGAVEYTDWFSAEG